MSESKEITAGSGRLLDRQSRELLDMWARDLGPALEAYFRKRVRSPAEAEDLVQEVFLRLARRADLTSINGIEGYLFTTARTTLVEHYRKTSNRLVDLHDVFDDDAYLVAGISPETVLADKEAIERLIAGLYELSERTRDIYVLYHFEDFKQMQIAAHLQIGIRTVERHLAQANAYLLKRVGRGR